MAPEIVSKKEYSGPPADVWALGVLYYALLHGKFPFKGANDKELFRKICGYDLCFNEGVSP
jgi:MAP/microtubule affinity-regulating kinase